MDGKFFGRFHCRDNEGGDEGAGGSFAFFGEAVQRPWNRANAAAKEALLISIACKQFHYMEYNQWAGKYKWLEHQIAPGRDVFESTIN